MKNKVIVSILLFVILLSIGVLSNAATAYDISNQLYAKGAKYGLRESDRVKIERYFAEYPATDAEVNKILAKADEIVAFMEEVGAKNYMDLTAEQKNKVKSLAQEAADIVGVTLVFKTSSVEIYKNGKLIETVTNNNGKLVYTGNNMSVVLSVSIIAIIALSTVVAKKRIANAE